LLRCRGCVVAALAGPDPHRLLQRLDEDLAVADAADLGGSGDQRDDLSATPSATTISIFIFGRNSIALLGPRTSAIALQCGARHRAPLSVCATSLSRVPRVSKAHAATEVQR
jgi:hypothetical protein